MKYRITAPALQRCHIDLPASKSIANRAIILNRLAGGIGRIEHLPDCDDTLVLCEAFDSPQPVTDIGGAGTAMRFLTAYYAATQGSHILTGSPRMQQRPIATLVEALQKAGADISYIEQEGFPPLRIEGKTLRGGEITMRGDISSQYISALLMIAPTMQEGLRLTLTGRQLSRPYIDMTIAMMRQYGATIMQEGNTITVASGNYTAPDITIEGDWTAASYGYEIALLGNTELTLNGVQQHSIQGDAKIAQYFEELGITTRYESTGVRLIPTGKPVSCFTADLRNEPDLAQTLAVTCALAGIPFRLEGLHNLRIKETDRITALQREAEKLGYRFISPNDGILLCDGTCSSQQDSIAQIETYDDHRMAMAFAPAALCREAIVIEYPEVVKKSYPAYWHNLQQAGFVIEEIKP